MRLFLIISLLIVLAVDIGVAAHVEKYEIDTYANYHQKEQYQRTTLQGPFIIGTKNVILWFLDPAERNDKAITALSTFVIAVFTIVLAFATATLVRMAKLQEKTSKVHERAYIFGGGPYGVLKIGDLLSKPEYRPKARDFSGPWQMVIHNYGRTPGYVFAIKWGLCPREFFDKLNMSVSAIVKAFDRGLLPLPHRAEFHVPANVDDTYPPSDQPSRNRHVEFERERTNYVGFVFFGRIDYKDVFGEPHHSTFKLLLLDDYTDPLPGCFSDDDKS